MEGTTGEGGARGRWPSGSAPLLVVALLVLGAVCWAHLQVPVVATGDGYAVYFPVAWGLLDGLGARAFDALAWGFFRMPGYPVALALVALFTGVGRAVSVVALGSIAALFGLGLRAEDRAKAAIAAALFCGTNCFFNMALVSTPDLLSLALTAGSFAVAFGASRDLRRWMLAGAILGLTALVRLNSLALLLPLLVLAIASEPRAKSVLGVTAGLLLALLPWSALSLIRHGELFWIPSGPTEVATRLFHAEVLVGSNDLWAALEAAPVEIAGRAFRRALIAGPMDVARHAVGLPAIFCLGAIPSVLRASKTTRAFLVALLLAAWAPFSLSGFEPRYYPIIALISCIGAAQVLAALLAQVKGTRPREIAAWLLVVSVLVARTPALLSHLEGQRAGAKFLDSTRPWVEAAGRLGPGCIATEETAYRMSGFRYLDRERGADHLCCCGLRPDASGFLGFEGYGHASDADLAGFRRIEARGATTLLRLYARDSSPNRSEPEGHTP